MNSYIFGLALLSRVDTSGVSNYLFNGHGDVVHLTGSSGVVTRTYDYDAFGNEKAAIAGDGNPFRYCGEYFDRETGTYYLRARYYNPATGRFGSEDPIRDGLNWYGYCYGNPVMFIDPSGLEIVLPGATNENYKDDKRFQELQKLTNHTLAVDKDGRVFIDSNATKEAVEEAGGMWFESGNTLLSRMIENDFTTSIVHEKDRYELDNYSSIPNAKNGIGSSLTIYFDFYSDSPMLLTVDLNTGLVVWASSEMHVNLAHELIHADAAMRGVMHKSTIYSIIEYKIPISKKQHKFLFFSWTSTKTLKMSAEKEELVTIGIRSDPNRDITENMIRAEQGLNPRGGY